MFYYSGLVLVPKQLRRDALSCQGPFLVDQTRDDNIATCTGNGGPVVSITL
jgi:hypothetical protein